MDIKSSSNWFDFGSLADLRAKADRNPEGAKAGAAQQFESLFINMMMKEMRKTVDRSDLLGSDAMETYEQMFDQQVALGMSKPGCIGLAKFLDEQMNRNKAPVVSPKEGLELQAPTPTAIALGQRNFNVRGR